MSAGQFNAYLLLGLARLIIVCVAKGWK
jgi:hypothetical protein